MMESEVGPSADGWEDDPDDWGSLEEPIPTNKVQGKYILSVTEPSFDNTNGKIVYVEIGHSEAVY